MICTIHIHPNLAAIKKADNQYRNLISNMHLSTSCKTTSLQDSMDMFQAHGIIVVRNILRKVSK